jgi:Berberine and berberine like
MLALLGCQTAGPQAIAALVENLEKARVAGQSRELDFTPWGGAYNRVPAHATAFAHRAERFLLKHAVVVDAGASAAERDAAQRWLFRSWASVHRFGSGRVYPNFPDPDLRNWPRAYHGNNYDRLLRIKAKYDRDNFFRFRQSLPPPAGDICSCRFTPVAPPALISKQTGAAHSTGQEVMHLDIPLAPLGAGKQACPGCRSR